MSTDTSVSLGIVGLGGYAASITDMVLRHPELAQGTCRLHGVFDPNPARHPQRVALLRGRGIRIFEDYDALLNEPIDALCLPVPIDLHRAYTERALQAGKAVLCEKPAAGSVDDVDAMIAARDQARRPVIIGFQDVYDPLILEAKHWLAGSEIGRIVHATFRACWPRDTGYFSRNDWAGKLKHRGAWVMDSPAANALSHFIHLAFFMLGEQPLGFARPRRVEAELYRANAIENYDTCGIRVETDRGPALFCMTHACATNVDPILVLRGEHGMMEITFAQIIVRNRGGTRTIPRVEQPHPHMLQTFFDLVRGRTPTTAVSTLEMARTHVVTVNAASEATPVHDVPREIIETTQTREGAARLHSIPGVETLLRECAHDNQLPHESAKAQWTRPGGSIDVTNYTHFAGPKQG
ncbi:MAG TPA: Gfo/Idh/MocA family oxidoreductase [Tepidisphaeraceae bacterium]|nr:Gfo/Idh/MocA family oxidoreductase [Tepidisphaeraceae bacterium]